MASILLAFSVDAWWERRGAERLVEAEVEAALLEVEQNATVLDRALEFQGAQDEAVGIVRASIQASDRLSPDSISVLVNERHLLQLLEVAFSAGAIRTLADTPAVDPALANELVSYLNRLEVVQGRIRDLVAETQQGVLGVMLAWQRETMLAAPTTLEEWMHSTRDPALIDGLTRVWLTGANLSARLGLLQDANNRLHAELVRRAEAF